LKISISPTTLAANGSRRIKRAFPLQHRQAIESISVGINRVLGSSIWAPLPNKHYFQRYHREAARELTSAAIEVGPWANAILAGVFALLANERCYFCSPPAPDMSAAIEGSSRIELS
jgi:hypothetical protein